MAAVEADAAGHPLSEGFWQRLGRMLDAGLALLDATGRPPRQGDGDEGRALVLDDPGGDASAVVTGVAAAVLGSPSWQRAPQAGVAAAVVRAVGRRHAVNHAPQRPTAFPDAGLVVLRSRAEDGPELWCRCDGGPLGFLSIAAHGHADALSLEVRHDGVDLLADPGTYCYHGEPELRQYFRSTLGHNTLEVGGVDQAVSGGPFLWTTRPRTKTHRCETGSQPVQVWAAEHDGYRRLDQRAVHRREVTLDSPSGALTVVDSVDARGAVPVRLSWHVGPAVEVVLGPDEAHLRWAVAGGRRRRAVLRLPADLAWSVHRGENHPPLGWYSPGFGRRVASTTLVGTGRVAAGSRLVTELRLAAPTGDDIQVAAEPLGSAGRAP